MFCASAMVPVPLETISATLPPVWPPPAVESGAAMAMPPSPDGRTMSLTVRLDLKRMAPPCVVIDAPGSTVIELPATAVMPTPGLVMVMLLAKVMLLLAVRLTLACADSIAKGSMSKSAVPCRK